MKARKTLDEKILLNEISVYCATMANFCNNKTDEMYQNSKQGIYTIIALMVFYMKKSEEQLLNYARKELNKYVIGDGNKVDYALICNEI